MDERTQRADAQASERSSDYDTMSERNASNGGENSGMSERDASNGGETSGLDRRTFVKTTGAAGAATALGTGASGSAVAQDGSWESEAEQRIEEHRKGDLEIQVEDGNGNPIPDADVSVEMQEHEFVFGTAVHAEFMMDGTEWGNEITVDGWSPSDEDQQRFREVVDEYFNTIVLENLHKWHLWEQNQDIADRATQWALDHGKRVRGHVCIWGSINGYALPPDVVEAMGGDYANNFDPAGQPNEDLDYVVSEANAHIEEIIDHYGDDIFEWEIVNEALPDHAPSIINAVSDDGQQPHTAPILGDWFELGQEVAEEHDIDIAMNDYNTLSGAYTNQWDQYEDQIDFLVNERGVDLDGVGMQSHHFADERLDPSQMWDAWERYSQYGAGLRITEFDMFGSGWDQQMQADYMETFLKMFFSHPDAEQFLMWGFWDPLHWGQEAGGTRDAPLFERDWTEKPAFDVYTGLVFDDWWTDESGTTDDSGVYATSAFLGEHEVTVETSQGSTTETISVTDSDGTTTVTIDAQGDGTTTPEGPDYPEGATDPDDDGLYEDLNGNGEADYSDVVQYFNEMESDGLQRNAEYYDYNGNGEIDFADVVDLFQEVN